MAETDYSNESQQRLVRMMLLLAGNEFHGLSPSEISKALKVSPGTTTRDLYNLKETGIAEQIEETARWRLGPKLVQIALQFQTSIFKAKAKMDEVNQRYTREP